MARSSERRGYRRGPIRHVWPSPSRPLTHRAARRASADYGAPAEPSWRGVDWPAHTHRAELLGADVNYVSLGDGDRAVVFVHGLGGCWQNWLENLPATAAAGYRAIALDLPGFGRSAMPAEPTSITGFARTVDALCEHLDLGPVALVGNSMGGFTSAETAIRHPARVERLVLVDAAGISSAAMARSAAGERFARAVLARNLNANPELASRILRRPGFTALGMGIVARYPTLLRKDLLAEQLLSAGAPGFQPSFEAILAYDFGDRLGEIGCPTLIVQGTEDILVPLGDALEFEERIPEAVALILEDTGHVPMLERPATFNRAMMEFLGQDVAPHEPTAAESPLLAEAHAHGGEV
jgi:pimeloyl-ACP methyl ester carboxylesterase